MSRIVGFFGPDAQTSLRYMAGRLAHGSQVPPGPLESLMVNAHLAFGSQDTGGTRRVVASDGLSVALDGAIYNRPDLGQAASDCELVAALYQRHGFETMLGRLNGDFSMALYDPAIDTLWLARDRLGVKPLYYAGGSAFLAFASRPRPLIGLPGLSAEVNRRFAAVFAGSHYRYFDNRPEESPYRDVAQLPAGHWLKYHAGRVETGRYWTLGEERNWDSSEEELAEQYQTLLLDAVQVRNRLAVRPAFTLSGGMDSSSVLASAVHATGVRQHAISTVYSDRTYDESDEIRTMLDSTVIQWHIVPVDAPDVLGLVRLMVEAHDEPVATATWLSHYLLCRQAARDGVGSLFGGLGGDELNAGEYEHFFYHFADLHRAGHEEALRSEVRKWIEYHDHPIYRKTPHVAAAMITRCADLSRPGVCLPDSVRLRRYYDAVNPEYYDLRSFEPVMEAPFTSYLKTRTYQDLTRETAPCCLRAEDRQTVAFGLENYLPFFDYRLIEFMFRVPGDMKIREGVTKTLLRQAMSGVLPEETRTRIKKTGWNAPAHVWFSGDGREPLLDLVNSREFRERGIYNVPEVLRLIDEHEAIVSGTQPRDNHMMFLWQLVNLEVWLQSVDTIAAA